MKAKWLALNTVFAGLESLAGVLRDWSIEQSKSPDKDEPADPQKTEKKV